MSYMEEVDATIKTDGFEVSSQHPFPTDGDSLYYKDIDVANSDVGGFSGVVTDFFDSLKTVSNDASVTNPKTLKVWFNRTIQTHAIGFGCDDITKNFSNIKIKVLGSAEEVRFTWDGSADNTKRNSYTIEMPGLFLNGFIIEFHTADEIGLSNIYMPKQTDVHATLSAVKEDGTVVDIGASDAGNLKITNAEDGLAIAKGLVPGSAFIHKFGLSPDFNTSDGIVDLWDGADSGHIDAMNYTFSTTNDIDSLSSDDAGDTFDIEVQGLDVNYALVIQTVTLTGLTRVALTTPLIRVFRMKNVGTVDNVGHIYCYVNGTITAGVPNTVADVRSVIQPGNNQTLMGIYTVPAGKTGYMRDLFASTAGANRDSNYVIEMWARPFGQVFQIKHVTALSDSGTSVLKHEYVEPEVFPEKTDIKMTAQMLVIGGSGAAISGGFDIVLVDN